MTPLHRSLAHIALALSFLAAWVTGGYFVGQALCAEGSITLSWGPTLHFLFTTFSGMFLILILSTILSFMFSDSIL